MTRKHPNLNFEYVLNDKGEEIEILRDGGVARSPMRLKDSASNATRHHFTDVVDELRISDADRYQLRDAQWRRETRYNRPGFRTFDDQEYKDGRTVVEAAYALRDAEQASAWKNNPPTGFGVNPSGPTGRQEGQICMTKSKRAGHLRYNSEGDLECVADEVADAKRDPQEAISDANQEYLNYVQNAWRIK